jgi:hypothetical protein
MTVPWDITVVRSVLHTPKETASNSFCVSLPMSIEDAAFIIIKEVIAEGTTPTIFPMKVPAPGPSTTFVDMTIGAAIRY